MADTNSCFPSAPLVIGGIGGSGTRVVARLVRHAGYDLGTDLNRSEDAVQLRLFHLAWVNPFLAAEKRGGTLSPEQTRQMNEDFRRAVGAHFAGCTTSNSRWGWKAPRSIYLLPFLHSHFPKMKFIHVIRDGRDMALSKNQSQLRKHGAVLLNRWERWFNSEPVNSLLVWHRVNLRAASYGETALRGNYHLLRFEEMCQQPIETTARLFLFLGADADAKQTASAEISAPSSVGRWRACHPARRAKFERFASSLREFGYLD